MKFNHNQLVRRAGEDDTPKVLRLAPWVTEDMATHLQMEHLLGTVTTPEFPKWWVAEATQEASPGRLEVIRWGDRVQANRAIIREPWPTVALERYVIYQPERNDDDPLTSMLLAVFTVNTDLNLKLEDHLHEAQLQTAKRARAGDAGDGGSLLPPTRYTYSQRAGAHSRAEEARRVGRKPKGEGVAG